MDRQVTIEVIPMPEAVRVVIEEQKLTIEWNRPSAASEPTRRTLGRAASAAPESTLPAEVIAQARELRAQGQDWESVISALFTWTPTRRGHRKSDPTPLDRRGGAVYQHRLNQLRVALGEAGEASE
jgi:hypothetical protein